MSCNSNVAARPSALQILQVILLLQSGTIFTSSFSVGLRVRYSRFNENKNLSFSILTDVVAISPIPLESNGDVADSTQLIRSACPSEMPNCLQFILPNT